MDPVDRGEELRAALGLAEADGLGPLRFRELVDAHGSARAALDLVARVGPRRAGVAGVDGPLRPAPRERLSRLAGKGIRLVSYGLPGYPPRLRHLHQPPSVLYLEGPGPLPAGRAVAVVGTRSATGYGRRMARDLAGGLAARGWSVVSGMAAGIDGAAHRAALEAEGPTVGVLGSGLDHEYPAVNRDLYRGMRRSGLLVTEFAPAVRPAPGLFPRRNRIIAALADAVVVVQAGRRSGALNTSSHALELGREVLAVPGPVGPPASVGVHGLLRDGAAPATCVADVISALSGADAARAPGADGEDADGAPGRDVLAALFGRDAAAAEELCAGLAGGPRHADDLADEAGLDAPAAAALLCRLELEGVVRGLPGGSYALEARSESR